MRFLNDVVLNAVDSSSNQNSSFIDASQMMSLSVMGVFTDAASAGTLKIQASNDHNSQGNLPFTPTNWVDISGASVSVSAGGVVLIPKVDISYQSIRVVWTRSAGAGTLTATLKSVGF